MGVDIVAYSRVRLAQPNDGDFIAYVNPDFPGRAGDIVDGSYYTFDDQLLIFSSSYHGYGIWRNELAKLAGYPGTLETDEPKTQSHAVAAWNAEKGPFWELINFADNEGIIAGPALIKLAREFAEYQSKADEIGGWFTHYYNLFRKGFEMAAESGAVVFH